jgi:DNA-binding PadR family transcriptional regulator
VAKGDYLGEFELLVLLAVVRLDLGAYGMEVRREIEARAARDASIGAVYATLDRLETKGLVRSREVPPDKDQARTRRLYLVTADGSRALARTRQAIDSMWQGVKVSG